MTTGNSPAKELVEEFTEPILGALNDAEMALEEIVADPKAAIYGSKALIGFIEDEFSESDSQEEFKAKFLESDSASKLDPLHIRTAGLIANYITASVKFPTSKFQLIDTYNERIFTPDKLVMKTVSPASKSAKPNVLELPFEVRAHIVAMVARFKASFPPPAGYLQFHTKLSVGGDVYEFNLIDATNMIEITIVENGIHIGDLKNQMQTLTEQYAMSSSRLKKSINLLQMHKNEIRDRRDVLQSQGRDMDARAIESANEAEKMKAARVQQNKKEFADCKARMGEISEQLKNASTPVKYAVTVDEVKGGTWRCQLLNLSA